MGNGQWERIMDNGSASKGRSAHCPLRFAHWPQAMISPLRPSLHPSMRIRINQIIDSKAKILIGLIDHVESRLLPRVLPALTDVVLIIRDHHQALLWIVVLVVADEDRIATIARDQVVQRRDLEERMKDRMRCVEL